VATIIKQLNNPQSEYEVYKLLIDEFTRWFNDLSSCRYQDFDILARDIYKWVHKK
jgi:hypothetical protein